MVLFGSRTKALVHMPLDTGLGPSLAAHRALKCPFLLSGKAVLTAAAAAATLAFTTAAAAATSGGEVLSHQYTGCSHGSQLVLTTAIITTFVLLFVVIIVIEPTIEVGWTCLHYLLIMLLVVSILLGVLGVVLLI